MKILKEYGRSLSAAHVNRLELQYVRCKWHINHASGVMRTFVSAYYKLQVVHAIMSDNRIAHNPFAVQTLDKNNEFLRKITFSDEATFQVSRKVNKQNICIWGTEHPHARVKHIRDSPKVNV
jgi:hypothetical protein